MRPLIILTSLAAIACGDNSRADVLPVATTPELAAAVTEQLRLLPIQTSLIIADDPAAALPPEALGVAVIRDRTCRGDCFELDRIGGSGAGYIVSAGTVLGAQYGLARTLEELGVGFFHPHATEVPDRLRESIDSASLGVLVEPEVDRRGLHLHILHPIEPYFAFWEPSPQNLEDAKKMVNWGIAIGANYFQWTALDDITRPAVGAPWRAHNKAIIDYIHERGAQVGVGAQLFGSSNLQLAFDLIDDPGADLRVQLEARYPILFDDADWDHLSLSFGEFFGADPDRFISTTNLAVEVANEARPNMTVSATVHVGDDQRIDYMGENLIYYFLVKFADASVVPWIHTVMYYNLFEDAGGAYHHEDFADHRQYLFDRINSQQPAGYHPETAYWVAFDNSVPIYAPLYIRSRWLDLDEVRSQTGSSLPEHIIFSTGWEWGYWQNDASVFRQSVTLAGSAEEAIAQIFAPMGERGVPLATAANRVAALEHTHLLEGRLAPYLAGRDVYIDAGYDLDIISQPKRLQIADILALDRAGREALVTDVIEPLLELASELEDTGADLSMSAAAGTRWGNEMADGIEVTAARARFSAALHRAALEIALGRSPDAHMAEMETALDRGRVAVERRALAMHAPEAQRLLQTTFNSTIYQYGYLKQAHELCYWERERIEIRNTATGDDELLPGCAN